MTQFRANLLAFSALVALSVEAGAQQRDGERALRSQPPLRTLATNQVSETRPEVAADPLAVKLREMLRPRAERLLSRRADREALVGFYEKTRQHAPLWLADGQSTPLAAIAVAAIRNAGDDALDPADYALPDLAAAVTPEAQAEAELKFTAVVLTYIRHLASGRMHWSRLSHDVDYRENFDPADALTRLASSSDLRRTLEGFAPPHAAYRALRTKYSEMRAEPAAAGPARIEMGQVLKFARDKQGRETTMSDARVPLLRERLKLPAKSDTTYDRPLADAISAFQKERGLPAIGQLNAATVTALNPPDHRKRLDTIALNMERWRWLPRELGRTHVALNIADYQLTVMNGGAPVWKTRVIVGKPTQATPLISEPMKTITVNPYWNVPQSIIYKELLPIYESSDKQIFERQGLKVERRPDGIRVFQPPGDGNALGRVRFNFPNKFLVYHHDTPQKALFAHERRAYSHGCMRVMDPVKYAEVLLGLALPRGNYTVENIRRMFSNEEKDIALPAPIPVHLTYQTAFVDDSGKLQFRDDVYSLDTKMAAQLRGDARQIADVAVDRPSDPNFKPTPEHRARLQSAAKGGNSVSFFEQLFR